jgi:hypothetical protein
MTGEHFVVGRSRKVVGKPDKPEVLGGDLRQGCGLGL